MIRLKPILEKSVKADFLKAIGSHKSVVSYRVHADIGDDKVGITGWYTKAVIDDVIDDIKKTGVTILGIEKSTDLKKLHKNIDGIKIENHINEDLVNKNSTVSKIIKIKFDINWNKTIGEVEDEILLAMSSDSAGIFTIGKDVAKYIGITENDVLKDIRNGKETPENAIIYGMCNAMNDGSDIYFWTNGNRLNGAASKSGMWPAILEQISHECIHLTRLILTRAIAKKMGADISKGEWLDFDFGSGKTNWPAIGDINKKDRIVMIDEEAFATATGLVVQQITDEFLKMASIYIPELNNK